MIYTKVYKAGNEEIVKLKMYLRGLGMGIIVTVLILGLSGIHKEELSEEEIRAKALQLGMVDSKAVVLSEVDQLSSTEGIGYTEEESPTEAESLVEETQATEEKSPTEETTATTEKSSTEETAATTETNSPTENISAEQTGTEGEISKAEPERSPGEENSEKIAVLQIRAGSGSEGISKQLEELGLVESAKTFDQYLCDQGYARYLRIGIYEIPLGSTEEEIAKMLTGR